MMSSAVNPIMGRYRHLQNQDMGGYMVRSPSGSGVREIWIVSPMTITLSGGCFIITVFLV